MSSKRSGFTLIELLVVISIIAILGVMTLNVIGDSVDQAREAATESTLIKINDMLEKRVNAFQRAMQGATLASAAADAQRLAKQFDSWPTEAVNNAELRPLRERIAQILGHKLRFRSSFPQNFVGDFGLTVPPDLPDASDILGLNFPATELGYHISDVVELKFIERATGQLTVENPGFDPSSAASQGLVRERARALYANHSRETESSEMLYLMITELDVFGAPPTGADQFKSGEVADTDNDGLLEFVDSWGNPFRFYRWPSRLLRPLGPTSPIDRSDASILIRGLLGTNAAIRDPLTMDPDDPIGLVDFEIARLARVGTLDLTQFVNEGNFHTLNTYHLPLIVSAGKDNSLGLFEPSDYANLGHLAQPNVVTGDELTDAITNRNRRAGARK